MRKPVIVALAIAVVLLLGTTGVLYQKVRTTSANLTIMKSEQESTQARYGEAINSIATIQDSLNAIVLGVKGPQLDPAQSERQLTAVSGDQVLDRVAVLRAGIERTKVRIQDLDARLKKSGMKVTGLQKMIAQLKQNLGEKEALVAQLSGRVDSLQTTVTGLATRVDEQTQTITTQTQTIEEKRRENGTIYFVIGTKKDLTKSGILEAKGGVLGVGKTLKQTGQFDESRFTALDTDQETVVRIPSAKVRVLSAQPVASYSLEIVGNETHLHITDPRQFRIVKELVILTT